MEATHSRESCSFLPYQSFSCEEEGVVTNMFLNESSIDLSTFMINRESCCKSRQLVEIDDISVCHHITNDMPYIMMEDSPCILFDPTNSSQVVNWCELWAEGCLPRQWGTLVSGDGYVKVSLFWLPSGISDNISTKTLSQSTFHADFIHDSMKVCYLPTNSLRQFYDTHRRFYNRIEVWLEGYYLSMI